MIFNKVIREGLPEVVTKDLKETGIPGRRNRRTKGCGGSMCGVPKEQREGLWLGKHAPGEEQMSSDGVRSLVV